MATRKKKKSKKTMKKKVEKVRRARKATKAKGRKGKARKGGKKKARASASVKAIAAKVTGKVVHYYDRIGVAIVELERPLRLGDRVLFKRGTHELMQDVRSMQFDHAPITEAKKGQVVGVKVDQEVDRGAVVVPA